MSKEKQQPEITAFSGGKEVRLGDNVVKLDEEGNFVSADAWGNIVQAVDGGFIVTRSNGTKIKLTDEGATFLTPPKSIGIKDLSQVSSYEIVRHEDKVHHRVTFTDGGTAQIIYDLDGKFVGTEGKGVAQSINNDDEMLLQNPAPVEDKINAKHL